MKTLILSFALSILLGLTARAELKFEQTQLELHPKVGDKEAVGHFKYKNAGDKPVRIKSVKTSCGCTAAYSQKENIAPGDSGEIKATFNIGDRTGTQVKSITVETDDPAQANTVLVLKSVIPQALEIKPTMVFWQMGDPAKPKTVTVTAPKDSGVSDIKVKPSTDAFQTEVTKVGDGQFKIEVKPRDTSREAMGTVSVLPENAPSSKAMFIMMRVMKSGASNAAQ